MPYQPTIGLEIHAELKTKTKMFCDSLNDPDEKHPNINICPVCLGHPGTLPVINKEAVKKVLKTGLALNGEIQDYSEFSRKNYFYPDLPKGYQISQYQHPLVKGGFWAIPLSDKKIRITRVHLEEDTGRLIHPAGADYTLVDFNRAGVPLMEMVTEPDISSAQEARLFAEEFQLLLRYLNVSDADMEKGQFRIEANVSLASINSKHEARNSKLGTKAEIKNLNSFRAVERAIEYEIKRQSEVLTKGEKVIQETRGWDEVKQKTVSQRFKEESHDYRYFPEPDLPPIKPYEVEEFRPENLQKEIPELPWQKRERFQKEYGVEKEALEIFINNKDLSDYFEKTLSELKTLTKGQEPGSLTKTLVNYLTADLQGLLKEKYASVGDLLIKPEDFAELVALVAKNEISSRVAKDILRTMFEKGEDPHSIIKREGLEQVSETGELENIVKKIIEENPKPAEDFKKGKEAALQFLVGQVIKQTRGRANPEIIQKIFKENL